MDDEIIHTGLANYFRGLEAVGGKLFLYKTRLFFQSHGLAINANPQTIFLKDIVNVKLANTLGIIPNGLLIYTKQGEKHRFVVHKRKEWFEKLNSILNLISK